jgi:hypothetical protein
LKLGALPLGDFVHLKWLALPPAATQNCRVMSPDTPIFRGHGRNAVPIRHLALLLPWLLLLAGCGTTTSYQPGLAAGPAKPAGYPIPIYTADQTMPRRCQLIGRLSIGHSEFTVAGGSIKGVMKTLMDTAHEKGADVVQITSIEKPGFVSSNYGLEAGLLRYADDWETSAISGDDFLNYLRQHQQTLDPIEGIWSDGSVERIGIIRDNSKPGRDFIGFALNPQLPSWRKGYKKMDIARETRPGAYAVKYYLDDFGALTTTVLLAHESEITFLYQAGDKAAEITLTKIGAPMPVH